MRTYRCFLDFKGLGSWSGFHGELVFGACRVDGKDIVSVPQRRLSFDCKTSKPMFSLHSDIIGHGGGEDLEKVSRTPSHLCPDWPVSPGGSYIYPDSRPAGI